MTFKTFFKLIVSDFTYGTEKMSGIIGFLNLFTLLSIWETRIGLEPVALFGSTTATYIVIIYAVGHFTQKIEKIEKIKEIMPSDQRE